MLSGRHVAVGRLLEKRPIRLALSWLCALLALSRHAVAELLDMNQEPRNNTKTTSYSAKSHKESNGDG